MKRQSKILGVAALLFAGIAGAAEAAPNWKSLIPFQEKVEADHRKAYFLHQDNGPWMIYATAFAGEKGYEHAHALVLELRRDYNMPAYIHRRHFDYSQPVDGLGLDRYGNRKKMKHKHDAKFDQFAVLVGNFESVDDRAVQETLEMLKYAQPKSLKLDSEHAGTQRYRIFREIQKYISPDEDKKRRGGMGNAFVTRNPMIPEEYFSQSGIDSFVVKMNENVEYSLLDCEKRFTVRVATFRGDSTMEIEKFDEPFRRNGPSKLELAADNAHRLTVALREKGIEAYEFHDRFESIVTIGGFDTVGTPRADGKIEINPAIHQIMLTYGPEKKPLSGGLAGLQPRRLGGVPFDIQPVPVEVPRASIGADYAKDSPYRQ